MCLRLLCVVPWISTSFLLYGQIKFDCMNVLHFIHWLVGRWAFELFAFSLAILIHAAVNIFVQVSVWMCAFVLLADVARSDLLSRVYLTRSGNLKTCRTVSQSSCTRHIPVSTARGFRFLLVLARTYGLPFWRQPSYRVWVTSPCGVCLHFPND